MCPCRYMYSGFLSLQREVDSFILSTASASINGSAVELDVSLALMPEDAFHADNFQEVSRQHQRGKESRNTLY